MTIRKILFRDYLDIIFPPCTLENVKCSIDFDNLERLSILVTLIFNITLLMKKFLFLALAFVVLKIPVIAQFSEYSMAHSIILRNNDTLFDVRLFQDKKLTNENQLTKDNFTGPGTTIKTEDIQTVVFNSGNYNSIKVEPGNEYKLMKTQVIGYLVFAESFSLKKEKNYYFQIEGKGYDISSYADDLDGFLDNVLPKYTEFRQSYSKKVLIDYKSLAEMASAYNTFMFPDKYVFVKYKNEKKFSIGAMAGGSINQMQVDTYEPESLYGGYLGIMMENMLSPKASIFLAPYFSYQTGTNAVSDVKLGALNLDIIPTITLYQKRSLKLQTGPGLGLRYYVSSNMKQANPPEFEKSEFGFQSFGYSVDLHVIVKLNEKHTTYIKGGKAWLQTQQISTMVISDNRRKGSYTGVSIGYSYTF